MRGKALPRHKKGRVSGITPAYAGKRFAGQHRSAVCQDHPRLCGEKGQSQKSAWLPQGSPPPMRGKVLLYVVLQIWDRITPAYAGKSCRVHD